MNAFRYLLAAGGIIGLVSVALGAMGTHMLEPALEKWYGPDASVRKLENWHVAVRYMFFHGIGLCLLALLAQQRRNAFLNWAGVCFGIGVLLFSGGLIAWVLADQSIFVRIVPVGGVAFLAGWLLLVCFAIRSRGEPDDG